MFIAGGAIASATRFAAVAVAADGPQSDADARSGYDGARRHGTSSRRAKPKGGARRRLETDDPPARESSRTPGIVPSPELASISASMNGPIPFELGTSRRQWRLSPRRAGRETAPDRESEFSVRGCNAALIAAAGGFGPGWAELPAVKGGRMGEMKPEYAQDIHLVADFPIAGRVVDAGGKPVAGAAVAVDRMFELADPPLEADAPGDQGR